MVLLDANPCHGTCLTGAGLGACLGWRPFGESFRNLGDQALNFGIAHSGTVIPYFDIRWYFDAVKVVDASFLPFIAARALSEREFTDTY
jgi:hypothetical protein